MEVQPKEKISSSEHSHKRQNSRSQKEQKGDKNNRSEGFQALGSVRIKLYVLEH